MKIDFDIRETSKSLNESADFAEEALEKAGMEEEVDMVPLWQAIWEFEMVAEEMQTEIDDLLNRKGFFFFTFPSFFRVCVLIFDYFHSAALSLFGMDHPIFPDLYFLCCLFFLPSSSQHLSIHSSFDQFISSFIHFFTHSFIHSFILSFFLYLFLIPP